MTNAPIDVRHCPGAPGHPLYETGKKRGFRCNCRRCPGSSTSMKPNPDVPSCEACEWEKAGDELLTVAYRDLEATDAWEAFVRLVEGRGWQVLVGDHDVSVCMPGPNSPNDDRYVRVYEL